MLFHVAVVVVVCLFLLVSSLRNIPLLKKHVYNKKFKKYSVLLHFLLFCLFISLKASQEMIAKKIYLTNIIITAEKKLQENLA